VLRVAVDDLTDLTEDLPEIEPEQPEPPRLILFMPLFFAPAFTDSESFLLCSYVSDTP